MPVDQRRPNWITRLPTTVRGGWLFPTRAEQAHADQLKANGHRADHRSWSPRALTYYSLRQYAERLFSLPAKSQCSTTFFFFKSPFFLFFFSYSILPPQLAVIAWWRLDYWIGPYRCLELTCGSFCHLSSRDCYLSVPICYCQFLCLFEVFVCVLFLFQFCFSVLLSQCRIFDYCSGDWEYCVTWWIALSQYILFLPFLPRTVTF